jgi:hypothetical protein
MKILMVLTSHDQLGNTGRKTGFWLEEGGSSLLRFQGCRHPVDSRFSERRAASDRSKERSAGESDSCHGPLQKG